ECSLSLTCREAEYLAERIRLSPTCSGSLLAELAAQRSRNADVPFVWQHPYSAKLPPKLGEKVHHARNFSEVMLGAQLLYNLASSTIQSENFSLTNFTYAATAS